MPQEAFHVFETPSSPEVAQAPTGPLHPLAENYLEDEAQRHEDISEQRGDDLAREQGHAEETAGIPIEDEDRPRRKPEAVAAQKQAAQRRRKRRVRETRYTDAGSDTPVATPPFDTEILQPADAGTVAFGVQAARRALALNRANRIAHDAQNDPRLALALSRARTDKSHR